jgi:ribosomal-protein-alanine N-acetyltransferase
MEQSIPIINFSPFPAMETKRLVLRRVTPNDVDEVFSLRSDPETMRYIPRPLAKTRQDVLEFLQMIDKGVQDNEFIHWAICFKEDPKLIGMICLIQFQRENFRTDVGYILSPKYRQLGIMGEALDAVIDYAFTVLKFHSLGAVIDPRNVASERLLLRKDFVKEAHFKECRFWNGEFLDDVAYSLITKVVQ